MNLSVINHHHDLSTYLQLRKRHLAAAEFVTPLAKIDPIYKEEEEAYKVGSFDKYEVYTLVIIKKYYHSTKQYREISRVGCPVLLRVRSTSNNTVGNKRVMFPGNTLYLW